MQKVIESKPNPNILVAIEQLRELGFNTVMLGSVNYNAQKMKEVDREKVEEILFNFVRKRELCERGF